MKYFSLNRQSPNVNFKEATIYGQAPDKGLYFPETIPQFSSKLISDIENISNAAIAYEVIKPYVANEIDDASLKRIAEETVDFSIPLVEVTENIFSLELFHGPTLAFKDVGARFMSRCLGYFSKDIEKKIVVLVATSGDTGGAVANGFLNVENVEVVILYPSGKVSAVQEKQLTTLGNNIHALEVDGSFDDCQAMVKQAFLEATNFENTFLTSANSINVARWLPQQFYYLYAYKQWKHKLNLPVVSVPSGNFGNICAGLMAKASGLPLGHFIAACNANDTIPRFFKKNVYAPQKSVTTISNAMDVAEPSNFVRVLQIFDNNVSELKENISAVSIDDDTTKHTLKSVYDEHNYLIDPHGAVGFYALEKYLENHPGKKGIFLETAHPVKFIDTVEEIIGEKLSIPSQINEVMLKEKKSTAIDNNYECLKEFLQNL